MEFQALGRLARVKPDLNALALRRLSPKERAAAAGHEACKQSLTLLRSWDEAYRRLHLRSGAEDEGATGHSSV